MKSMRRLLRLSPAKAVAVFVAASLGPLAFLSVSSIHLAEDAVRDEVEARVQTTALVSARLVENSIRSNVDLVSAYATRTLLAQALDVPGSGSPDLDVVDFQVNELTINRPGIVGAFLADPTCRLTSVRPVTPSIIGMDFSFRDWCTGVRSTGAAYVSEAYRTAIAGEPMVIAVVVPVRSRDEEHRVLGYLGAIYDLQAIQAFSAELAQAHHLALTIVDNRGTVLADETGARHSDTLFTAVDEPMVVAGLAGRTGVSETAIGGNEVLAAYAPVSRLGWVVIAQVPSAEALAGVSNLRSTVLRITAVLGLVLLAAAGFLVRILRRQRRAERTERLAESRMRKILDAATDGFVAVQGDGVVTAWNAAAARMFGWTSDEAIGRRLSELIVPVDQRASLEAGLARFIATGEGRLVGHRSEMEALHRSGRVFSVELAVSAVSEAGGWTFNAFVHDITERKRRDAELALARDQALEGSRLKSEFLANMSHEIRTPMNGVIGMTSLLLETGLDGPQRDAAETVLRSGESLLVIINDILDFSKIEAGRLDLEMIGFGTRELLAEVTALLESRAVDKGLHLLTSVDPDVPEHVTGDPGRIRQIVTNLVSNAIKFAEHGEVAVRVSLDPPIDDSTPASIVTLRVEVVDTGIGVATEHQQAIFQSFTQADSSTTRRYGGTGLGLAISQQLVELMGGTIGMHSTVGNGSTFWFTVPVEVAGRLTRSAAGSPPADPDLRGTAEPDDAAVARPRVLVAEDNPINQRVVLGLLESLGYDVHLANDGREAVAAATTIDFDVILMDCQMPVTDGFQATALIRTAEGTDRHTPIVALTASAMLQDRQRCLEAGMDDHLAKPVRKAELASVLTRLLRTPRPHLVHQPTRVDGPLGHGAASITARLDELFEGLGDDTDADRTELLESFLRRSALEMDHIDAALLARDHDALRARAHAVKGMAGNVGASGVADAAAEIEDAVLDGDGARLPLAVAELHRAVAEANDTVRDMFAVSTTVLAR
jgi:PAS domain S-box-containing protein